MNQKNKRLHLTIADKKLQDQIKDIMETQGLTQEQLLIKYLKFPIDDFEIAAEKFNEFKKCYRLCVVNENVEDVDSALEYTWALLANIANGKFGASSYIKAIDANLDAGLYLADVSDK